ncbi:hypothetical protein [Pseudomonas putida]|uniref:Transmembrane protein n=1 Tax=Pseudomonas putida TaxID=303 RepID=A0A7V8EJ56_PSEPU|nr:hypothetical protein [Pseudomonas putida]KAF0255756.1 hypothetical protein GN299_06605 [Pseudomonas putida]
MFNMHSLKGMFTPRRAVALALAAICFFAVTASLSLSGQRTAAGVIMLLSAAVIFPCLLEMNATRVVKGYWLVAFGAFIVVWHATVVDSTELSETAKSAFQVMVQLFSLACAGAGGSIIATHGDKSSTDADTTSSQLMLTSDSQRLIELQKLSKKQTYWIKVLCGLLAVFIICLVADLLVR